MQTILLCVILSMIISIVFGQWYMWQASKLLTMQLKKVEKVTTGVIDEIKWKLGINQEVSNMDKTRDEMNGNQRMLLSYLESLVPEDDVLMGLAEFQFKLSEHSTPKEVYIALGVMSNAEVNNVLHELTRPF